MEIADIVAMVIAFLAILYSFIATLSAIYSQKKGPEEPSEEFEWLEEEKPPIPVKEKRKIPPPPPKVPSPERPLRAKERPLPPEKKFATEKFIFHSPMEGFEQKREIEERKLTIHLKPPEELVSEELRPEFEVMLKKPSIAPFLKAFPNKKMLWLAHEVVSTPLSLRASPLPWNK